MAYLRSGLCSHGAIADLCSPGPVREAGRRRQTGGRSQSSLPPASRSLPARSFMQRRRSDRHGAGASGVIIQEAPAPQQGAMAPWLIYVAVYVATAPSLTCVRLDPSGRRASGGRLVVARKLAPPSQPLPARPQLHAASSVRSARGRGLQRDHSRIPGPTTRRDGAVAYLRNGLCSHSAIAGSRTRKQSAGLRPKEGVVVHALRQHSNPVARPLVPKAAAQPFGARSREHSFCVHQHGKWVAVPAERAVPKRRAKGLAQRLESS